MPAYWLLRQKLGVATPPADRGEVDEWASQGFSAAVSLLNEADLPATWTSIDELHGYMEEKGFKLYWRPVLSRRALPPPEAVKAARWIDQQIGEGRPTLILCGRAWGRSASLAAAYLVYKGASPEEALRLVEEEARKTGNNPPESEEQRRLPFAVAKLLG